ncbi:MAG: L,D-transpeptidase [Bacteroides sp.]|nr:L,D-transpeptidase [Bacteroides sp.]
MERRMALGCIIPCFLMGLACQGNTVKEGEKKQGFVPAEQQAEVARKMPQDVVLEKQLLYDQHTLADTYPYKGTTREFQWEKIKVYLAEVENINATPAQWGYIENRGNEHGRPPLVENPTDQGREDKYGVDRNQGIPLYIADELSVPERYGVDGMLVKLVSGPDSAGMRRIEVVSFEGQWLVPEKYVEPISVKAFNKLAVVDRKNQNITSLDYVDGKWLIRSMNPATTGLEHPPYQKETPLGVFVVQEKKEKMYYLKDGTEEITGFAPYASRFSNGGYIHGVPVNYPRTQIIEYSNTLGTTPRSHMCVRNATSHAKFLYDRLFVNESLIIVIE